MKNTVTSISIVIFAAFVLLACSDLTNSNEATITLSLSGGSQGGRALVWPPSGDLVAQLDHRITLRGPGGTVDISAPAGTSSIQTQVIPGLWRVDVEARLDGLLYATGTDTLEARAGGNNYVVVQMQGAGDLPRILTPLGLKNYLDSKTAADSPVDLFIAMELSRDNWIGILDALESAPSGVTVNLNLTHSTRAGSGNHALNSAGVFDARPNNLNDQSHVGMSRVVSMTLPEAALTINRFPPYIPSNVVPDAYFSSLTHVNIGNGVTTIADDAFSNASPIATVVLGNRVTTIGMYAFAMGSLTTVNIPNSVTTIQDFAFNQTALTSVTIPASVTSIGNSAFVNNDLTSVTFAPGSNITSFHTNAFNGDLQALYSGTGGGPGTYTRAQGGGTWTKQ